MAAWVREENVKTKTGNDKMMRVLVPSHEYRALEAMAQLQNTTVSEIVRRQIKAILSRAAQATQATEEAA